VERSTPYYGKKDIASKIHTTKYSCLHGKCIPYPSSNGLKNRLDICKIHLYQVEEKRILYLVAWTKFCRKNKEGGVGMRQNRFVNQAFKIKLAWKLCVGENKERIRICKHKYLKGERNLMTRRFPLEALYFRMV